MEIRTPKEKLYGTLDVKTYIMTVNDGKNVRQFPVPKQGAMLWYTSGRSPTENVEIPPQQVLLHNSMNN